ncbi:selenide, water dikinase SelD [Roseobacter sp. HKCCA0434]|uniref:selenide, water dikinase SelD n=1 Tax=Roseobacter sp. HKCCA0434 TaxID=3079297 RepID=UPI002905BF1E|nr:selenide, water dikinase SelD [Roseobacter sp. HKCCA0434]
MRPTHPVTRDLVLIGGGHAHALMLRRWGMDPLPGARLTLITPEPTAPYTGMLPGFVAGHYARKDLDIDMMRLARFAGARVVLKPAIGLDPQARRVTVPGRAPIAYDVLSINVGISATVPTLPGFTEHAVPAKPLGPFADRWSTFVSEVEQGETPEIAVIGCGIAGAELALAMHHRLRDHAPRITICEHSDALANAGRKARAVLTKRLAAAGITVMEGAKVTRIHATHIETDRGDVPSRFTVGAAGATPQPWLAETRLAQTDGFLDIGPKLASTSHPQVFAVGDCAHMTHAPREKAGVFAVRQAPILTRNLRAALGAGTAKDYRPQKDYLKLVSLGEKAAVADYWPSFAPSGAAMWRWKDHIDRKFMDRLADLPDMAASDPPPREAADGLADLTNEQPLCGGCGAKVGADVLTDSLAALPAPSRPDILRGTGDDAALLTHAAGAQSLTTDHFRAFIEDPWLLTRIAALHAMGDVWAMGGRPQAALSQIILPRMAPRPQAETLREILDAAQATLAEAGADLVGGHSSLGAEMTIGFTVTGLIEGRAVGNDGAGVGDVLLLTKPLGTGTILAADMQAKAPGPVVARALDWMARSPARAAAILAQHATAMTDVTGFGLAGHLMTMLEARGLSARLTDLPLIDGAEALAAAGHRSSLYPQNRARAMALAAPAGPRADLAVDPQTSGGMLAAVPPDLADQVEAELKDAGEPVWRIGTLGDGPVAITLDA